MDKRTVVEKLLRAQRNGQWNMSSAFGGAMGVNSGPQVSQVDMNKAIEAWLHGGDDSGIREVAGAMRLTGVLADTEYEQIMNVIDGEK